MMEKDKMEKDQSQKQRHEKETDGMGMQGKKDHMQTMKGGGMSMQGHMKSMKGGGMGKQGRCPKCGKKMEGKIGPHRGKGPAKLTDEQIKSDVELRLTEDSWLDASEVEVSFVDGVITLTGDVEDWDSKRRAEDIALQAMGVKDVQNNLTLKSS